MAEEIYEDRYFILTEYYDGRRGKKMYELSCYYDLIKEEKEELIESLEGLLKALKER